MFKVLFNSSFFVSFICLASFAAQPSGGKVKIAVAPQGQMNVLSSSQLQNHVLPSIKNSLFNFTSMVGAKRNKNPRSALISQLNGIQQNKLNAYLQLPSMDNPAANTIETISWNRENGTPRFIELQPSKLQKNSRVNAASMELAANTFLVSNKSLLRIKDPQNEFLLKHSLIDDLGMTHLKYSQTYNGIEVWGKEVILHLDAEGNVISLTGSYESTPSTITDLNGILN
jgi:hypothetical protein